MNRKMSPQLYKPGPLVPVRSVAFIPNTPVKNDKGKKMMVTMVNNMIDLPCLSDSSPCFTDSRASTTPACLENCCQYIDANSIDYETLTAVLRPRDLSMRRMYSQQHFSATATPSADPVNCREVPWRISSSNAHPPDRIVDQR